jgi:GNAT superfamily N-acetyltransferase
MCGVSDVRFRRARREDLADLVRLLADDDLGRTREVAPSEDGDVDDAYVRAFDAIDADDRQLLVVAELDGAVAGTLQLTFHPNLTLRGGERAQLVGVRVDAAQRGSGIGRQLVSWSIDQARARGCRLVQLTTNEQRGDARRFYESLGFVASHVGMKLALD